MMAALSASLPDQHLRHFQVADQPSVLDDDEAFRRWRDTKLAAYPSSAAQLIVEVRNPGAPSVAELAAMRRRLAVANMVIYAGPGGEAGHDLPRSLGSHFGLRRIDANWLSDEDGVSDIRVRSDEVRGDMIPYTSRPIQWHTDGYYNPPERSVRAMVLHCVRNARAGGENDLLDHELAYLWLRTRDPEGTRALFRQGAMTIPPRMEGDRIARAAQTGPVFSTCPMTAALHMRYTARTRSIAWQDDAATRSGVATLETILADPSACGALRIRLEPGMGILAANVLHTRSAFLDDPEQPRLLYRVRYFDAIRASSHH